MASKWRVFSVRTLKAVCAGENLIALPLLRFRFSFSFSFLCMAFSFGDSRDFLQKIVFAYSLSLHSTLTEIDKKNRRKSH